jgi:hypothetical protein
MNLAEILALLTFVGFVVFGVVGLVLRSIQSKLYHRIEATITETNMNVKKINGTVAGIVQWKIDHEATTMVLYGELKERLTKTEDLLDRLRTDLILKK